MKNRSPAWIRFALTCGLCISCVITGCKTTQPTAQAKANPTVTFKINVPDLTPKEDKIFMISDFDDFFHPDVIAQYTAKRNPDGYYYLNVPKAELDHFFFLFARDNDKTKGNERIREFAASGKMRPDRFYRYKGRDEVVEIDIESWEDFPSELKPGDTVSRNVTHIVDFEMPQLGRSTDLMIYLPPGYHAAQQEHFPVIYMTDGQNLFDEFTSFAGEWRIDEILDEEIMAGRLPPVIVVGIYNGPNRANEYIPWDFNFTGQLESSQADKFLAFIRYDLKPYIDSTYRTLPNARFTGIAGSSFGGLFALYAGITHPQTFGMVGAFSPSIWVNMGEPGYPGVKELITQKALPERLRLYMDAGAEEPPAIDEMRMMKRLLNRQAYPKQHLKIVEDPRGGHNERSWSARFPTAMKWLLQADS
ncbi:alpha/beta hydrolase [Corallincola platygyrae]|uniref:Alpha/beta hydrolase n=1 Tax=Corallincola platygyrae TaxID=1193278 RepID=A0ABW4XKS6_9GAMM